VNILIFNLFYWILFIFGKTVNDLIFKSKNIANIPISIFYPMYSLLFIGNLSFLLNFFVNGNIIILIIFILIGFSLVFQFYKRFSFESQFVSTTLINSSLAISSYGINFHYDAGGYHLLHQNWILNEKIVLGISNIIFPLGNQSLYEYISFNFWLGNNFIFLHYLNLIFFTLLFNFAYFSIKKSTSAFFKFSSLVLLAFAFLDNFGLNGGANGFPNIQNAGKPDIPVAILLIIFNLLIINFIFEKTPNVNYYKTMIYMGLFLIQLKPTSFHILVPLLYIILKYRKTFISRKFLKFNLTLSFLSLFWLLKNVITTGCLLFPVKFTCMPSLEWYSNTMVSNANKHYSSTYVPYELGTNIIDWFNIWKTLNYNEQIITNFLWSFIVIFISCLIFGKKIERNLSDLTFLRIYFIFSVLAFFMSVPLFRYFFGIFTPLIFIFTMNRKLMPILNKNVVVNYLSIIFIFLSPFLIVRGFSFNKFIEDPLLFTKLEAPVIEYQKNTNWGYSPVKDEFSTKETYGVNEFGKCWLNLECNPENREIYIKEISGYKMITESK